jgi:hypothetical protein
MATISHYSRAAVRRFAVDRFIMPRSGRLDFPSDHVLRLATAHLPDQSVESGHRSSE